MGGCSTKAAEIPKKNVGKPSARVPCSALNEKGVTVSSVVVKEVVPPMEARGFRRTYEVGKRLGQGNFAICVVGTHHVSRKEYAIKCIVKKSCNKQEEKVKREIFILDKLKEYPNITQIKQYFLKDSKFYYIVSELMKGGELFDRIVKKTSYNENEAREVCRILLDAVGYMHGMGIVHRDLKPENLLLTSQSDDASIKIADFGLARSVADGPVTDLCGTPAFMSPELLRNVPYTTEPDMWSVGVIIYVLLSGTYPFQEYNRKLLWTKIRKAQFRFPDSRWAEVSEEAKDLIKHLLVVDQKERYTAAEALNHPWMLKRAGELTSRDLSGNLHAFKVSNTKRKLLAAIHSIMLAKRFAEAGGLDFSDDSIRSPIR